MESVLHALRNCPQVRAVWLQLGVRDTNQIFQRSDLQEWLVMNGKVGNRAMYERNQWSMLFSFAIWIIWKNRNQSIFSGKAQNPNLTSNIVNQTTEFMYCANSPRNPVLRVVMSQKFKIVINLRSSLTKRRRYAFITFIDDKV